MKTITKHYPMTDRLIVTQGYYIFDHTGKVVGGVKNAVS